MKEFLESRAECAGKAPEHILCVLLRGLPHQVRVHFPFDFLNAVWSLSKLGFLTLNPCPTPVGCGVAVLLT